MYNAQTVAQDVQSADNVVIGKASQDAQGQALANVFMKEVQNQGNRLMRFMKELCDLNQEGRRAFRVQLQNVLKEQRAYVKAHEEDAKHEFLKRTLASSTVRTSEAVKMSEAFDAGFHPQFEKDSQGNDVVLHDGEYLKYHALIAAGRLFLETNASGPTQKRGRKAKDNLTKVEEYIVKAGLSDEELQLLQAWIASGAKIQKAE